MEYATPVAATAASVAATCCNRVSTDCGVLPLVVSVVMVVACAYACVCVEDACQLSYCFALADDADADDVDDDDVLHLLRLWHVEHDIAPIAAVVAAASCAAASRARTSPAVSAAAVRCCCRCCWADLVPCGSNSRICLRVHKQAVTFVALSMAKPMMMMRRQKRKGGQRLAHCKGHYSQHCGACKCVCERDRESMSIFMEHCVNILLPSLPAAVVAAFCTIVEIDHCPRLSLT